MSGTDSHTANKTPTPMTDEAVRLANPLALPTLCRKLERKLAEHRDNGRRLMEAADGWKAEAERLRGIEQALEAANATLAKIKVHEAKLIASEQRLHHENIRLRDELAEAKADAEAVRELMSVYNLGGWTDAVAPMKRALKAEADLEVLGDELERIRAKLVLAADDEIMRQESAASETRPTSTGEWQWPVDTVGKLIDSLKTLPTEMPFSTAYFVENDGVRVARTTVPSISYGTVSNGRVQKFDAANKSLVMWASQDEAHRCVVGTTESATTQEMRHAGKPASHAPASSADLVLVPRNPTVEMLTAGAKAADLHSHSPRGIWAAMLAAAGNHERRG